MLGLSFFSKFDWGFIIYIAKTGSKKIEAFLGSVKFLSPKVTLYLYFFIGFAWNTIVMSGLLLLAATLKWYISSERFAGSWHVASLEPMVHCQNVSSLSLFYKCFFGRCSSELAQLVPLRYSQGGSTHYSDIFHDVSVTIPRFYKDICVSSFFPCT